MFSPRSKFSTLELNFLPFDFFRLTNLFFNPFEKFPNNDEIRVSLERARLDSCWAMPKLFQPGGNSCELFQGEQNFASCSHRVHTLFWINKPAQKIWCEFVVKNLSLVSMHYDLLVNAWSLLSFQKSSKYFTFSNQRWFLEFLSVCFIPAKKLLLICYSNWLFFKHY